MSEAKDALIRIVFREGMAVAEVTIENASPSHLYAASGLINYEADKMRTGIDFQNLQDDRLKRSIMDDPTGGLAMIGKNGRKS